MHCYCAVLCVRVLKKWRNGKPGLNSKQPVDWLIPHNNLYAKAPKCGNLKKKIAASRLPIKPQTNASHGEFRLNRVSGLDQKKLVRSEPQGRPLHQAGVLWLFNKPKGLDKGDKKMMKRRSWRAFCINWQPLVREHC
jgi:hypothetical protein